MKVSCLGTGSSGNCYHVKFESGATVILDAGVQPKKLLDKRISMTDTLVLVTHEHKDHIGYSDEMKYKYGALIGIPEGVEAFIRQADYIFKPNVLKTIGDLIIIPFSVIHEAVNPLGYFVSDGEESLIYITDAGVIPEHITEEVNVLIIEANYTQSALQDQTLLPYVVGRVTSGFGHLSVDQASEFAEYYLDDLDLLLLTHISKKAFDIEEYKQSDEISMTFKEKAIIAEAGGEYFSLPF